MIRQGKYTAEPSLKERISQSIHGRWEWFRDLSKKKKALYIGGPILAILVVLPLITYAVFARDISDPERLMNRNQTGIILLDKDGEEFYSFGTAQSSELLKLDQIADDMEKALIAAEDKNFYNHSGFSFLGTVGALYGNLASGDATRYGGSTLTQQLVKNTLLTSDKSYIRKYQELSLAIAVDRRYSKDEILEFYLNSVYFGEGAFGVQDAAETYFDKSAADLTAGESALLVGLLPAPSAYSPISGEEGASREQQERVLTRMVQENYLTDEDRAAALKQKIKIAEAQDIETIAPHYSEMVVAELNERYGEETVTRSGYRVTTGLDIEWQKQAEKIVADQSAINAQSGGDNAAMVAIDPKTGQIRALVGSSDYNNEDFGKVNMATSASQPGSSFKPIYYTEALAQKLITPATIIQDEPTTFGNTYEPENFDFRFRGDISVRDALSQSLNIPAVKVMEQVGVQETIDTAEKMGITIDTDAENVGLSLALGAAEVTPVEMTNAYAAFANKGEQYSPTIITSIKNKFGDMILENEVESEQVVDEGAAFLISDILSDNEARAPTFGGALVTSRDTAVKTGSTDDNRDAWTIGYTPTVAVGAWVGNSDNEPMSAGGSGMAGPIWQQSIEAFFADVADEEFTPPADVERVRVCAANGLRSTGEGTQGTFEEWVIKDSLPSETCEVEKPEPKDSDNDGVIDDNDDCRNTPRNTEVDGNGCPVEEDEEEDEVVVEDSDGDGVPDEIDVCPDTKNGVRVNDQGCSRDQRDALNQPVDSDNDGVTDELDTCPDTPAGEANDVDADGCSPSQLAVDQNILPLPSRRMS